MLHLQPLRHHQAQHDGDRGDSQPRPAAPPGLGLQWSNSRRVSASLTVVITVIDKLNNANRLFLRYCAVSQLPVVRSERVKRFLQLYSISCEGEIVISKLRFIVPQMDNIRNSHQYSLWSLWSVRSKFGRFLKQSLR